MHGICGNYTLCKKKHGVQTTAEFFIAALEERFWGAGEQDFRWSSVLQKPKGRQQDLLGCIHLPPSFPGLEADGAP